MKIFETDGKLKYCAVLAVFVSLLVSGCSLFDHDDKDHSKNGKKTNGGEKSISCEEAKANFNACVAAKGSASDCVELHDQLGDICFH